jgi:ABC-type polysaccharide/polyol phosphate export permease
MVIASVGPMVLLLTYLGLGAVSGNLHWTVIFLPVPVALLAIMLLGSAWLLMVVGLVFVDIREIIGVIFSLIVYFSPVVLSPSMVPPWMWRVIEMNPLSHVVISFRDVLEAQLHPWSWLIFVGITVAAVGLGIGALTGAKRLFGEYI